MSVEHIFFLTKAHTKTNHSLVVARIVKGGKEFNGYGMACLSISNKKQQLDFALFLIYKVDV